MTKPDLLQPMLTDGENYFDLSAKSLIDYDGLTLVWQNNRIEPIFYSNFGKPSLQYCINTGGKPFTWGFNSYEDLQKTFHKKLNTII